MQTELNVKDRTALVSVSGDLDRDTLSQNFWDSPIITSTNTQSFDAIDVSLKDVDRVDTAGLAWLLNLIRDSKKFDKKCKISHFPKKLLELAKLSGAEKILQTEVTNDE